MAVTGSDTPTHRRRKTPDVTLERAAGEVRNFHPSPEIFIFRRRRAAEEMVGPFIISRIRSARKRDGEEIDFGGRKHVRERGGYMGVLLHFETCPGKTQKITFALVGLVL